MVRVTGMPTPEFNEATARYKIVNSFDALVDPELKNLTLTEAENALCRCLNHGQDAYLTEQLNGPE